MGLLLSVLVACVGVVELLAFYSNVRRNFVPVSSQTNLAHLNKTYFEELERHRTQLQCQQLQDGVKDDDERNNKIASSIVSDEFQSKSRSTSPPRVVLTEKEAPTDINGEITREDLAKVNVNNVLNEGTQRQLQIDSAFDQTLIIQTQKPVETKTSLPSKSLSPNSQTEQNIETFKKPYTRLPPLNIQIEPVTLETFHTSHSVSSIPQTKKEPTVLEILEQSTTVLETPNTPRSRSPSPIPQRSGEQDFIFRRSPSPYPPLVLPVPRNSICNELLENATVSVAEVEEEALSRSPTPEKLHVILESKHNTTEYWTNKVLVVPPTKTHSQNEHTKANTLKSEQGNNEADQGNKKLTVLSNDSETSTKNNNEIEDEFKEYDEQFLDSLDGVKKKKLSRNSSSRRSRKKRGAPNVSFENEPKDECLSSSMQNNDAQTAKTLTDAANVLKNVKREADCSSESSAGTSKDHDSKTAEPFWLIFSGEYTKAMNKDWHGQHFCCWQCDESLTGQRYVLRDDHPYCVSCYESVFANACEKCSRIIGIDSKDLSYKDKHWHEACFLCTTCGESLVDRQFGSKGDRIYCGRCYDEQFASRCDGCHEIFRAGTKKMEYKTRQWHEKCFCCCVCKVPIGTQSFIPREQEIYCAKCYEEKFATRCIKCNKVITSGGVTYKNEPWHRECFTCTHCSKSLAGERFTSRDEKPYCAECFGELFAKRCFACNKPITGIGGTKFISFEDRHWHNDCFFCASCRTSLVGRGFITDQDDIICPECAKQKLM